MDRAAATTLIKQRLKRSGDTTLDDIIHTEMQLVQQMELEGGPTLPWFLLSENISATTTADEERILLPADVNFTGNDFIREYEDGALWVYDSTVDTPRYRKLTKDDYETILQRWPTDTGLPKKYSSDGTYFRLKPTPDAAYTIRMKCYLRDQVLDTNLENKWLKYAADLMIGKVGYNIATWHLRDKEAAAAFDNMAKMAYSRLMIEDEARKQANLEPTMGDL